MDVGVVILALIAVVIVVYLVTVIQAAATRAIGREDRPEQGLLVWPRWLLAVVVALLALWVLYRVRGILLPFVVGAIIAYLLNPAIDRLERRQWPRTQAIALVFSVFLLVFVIAALLVIPALIAEAQSLSAGYEVYSKQLNAWLVEARQTAELWGRVVGLLPSDVRAAFAELGDRLQAYGLSLLQQSIGLVNRSVVIVSLLIISPIVTFWFLRDYHDFGRLMQAALPERQRESTLRILQDINRVAGSYLLGMAIMAGIVAAYAIAVLTIAGVHFSVLLGIMTGVLYVVPYVGYPSAVIISGLVMVATGQHVGFIVVVLAIMVAGNVISDYILYPRIVGGRVGVHPLIAIFALLAGGALFGFVGVVIAVPLAGVIKVLTMHFWPEYFPPDPAQQATAPSS